MEKEINALFPNFSREYQKVQNKLKPKEQLCSVQSLMANEVEPLKDVPTEYAAYVSHVNNINRFKKQFVSYDVVEKVTDLLKSGDTIQHCRDYVGNINSNWNQWEKCYDSLKRTYSQVSQKASWIEASILDSIKALEKLVEDNYNVNAKRNLSSSIDDILDNLDKSKENINVSVDNVQEFQKNFDNKQVDEYKKIIEQLDKESTLQAETRDKIAERIKELQFNISKYNNRIAALAIAAGLSLTLVTFSFYFGGFKFGMIVGIFVLPVLVVATIELANLGMELSAAKKEIESYGDYKNSYNAVIASLAELEVSVNRTIEEAKGIKKEMNDVCAPWNALKIDLDKVKEALTPKKSETGETIPGPDYDALLKSFKDVLVMWRNIKNNLSYLDLKAAGTNVVQTNLTDFDKDAIIKKAKEKGISMDEYIAA